MDDLTNEVQKLQVEENNIVIRKSLKSKKKESTKNDNNNVSETHSQPIPSPPSNAEDLKWYKVILEFAEDTSKTKLEFPANLNNEARKRIHEQAGRFGLDHYSRGSKTRYLTVEKKTNIKQDEWQWFGYIGLMGPSVDASAQSHNHIVPEEHIKKRIKRDGPINHITLISQNELTSILQKIDFVIETFSDVVAKSKLTGLPIEVLMNIISEVVEDDWEDLGLGKFEQTKNEVWYKVVKWSSAQNFRQALKLPPKDFHITIGYSNSDVHNVVKDETTLVKEEVSNH